MQAKIHEREAGEFAPPLMKKQQLKFGRRGFLSIVALFPNIYGLALMCANSSQLPYYSHRMIRHSTPL